MMTNNMMAYELNEQETNGVTGGNNFPPYFWYDFENALKKDSEAKKQAEAAQTGAHAHGNGASGGW